MYTLKTFQRKTNQRWGGWSLFLILSGIACAPKTAVNLQGSPSAFAQSLPSYTLSNSGGLTSPVLAHVQSVQGVAIFDHIRMSNGSGTCLQINADPGSTVVVINSEFGPCVNGNAIQVTGGATVAIQNNYIHDAQNQAIFVQNAPKVLVSDNRLVNVASGVMVNNTGFSTGNDTVAVQYNSMATVFGFTGSAPSTAIQLIGIQGPNSSVSCNQLLLGQVAYIPASQHEFPNTSGVSDAISLLSSSGTSTSPIQVVGNRILGSGQFPDSGAIKLADVSGPSDPSPGYVEASDNLIVNPGNYGISVPTGHDISVNGNYILGNPTNLNASVGIRATNTTGSGCSRIQVSDNFVYFVTGGGAGTANYQLSQNCGFSANASGGKSYTAADNASFPSVMVRRPSCSH